MKRSGVLAQLVAVILAFCAAAAFAQLRTIPPGAQRGWIRQAQEMQVLINGRRLLLAPGAQIRDAENRIIVPAALPAGALVKYTLDTLGQVNRVWILTPVEAEQPDPRR